MYLSVRVRKRGPMHFSSKSFVLGFTTVGASRVLCSSGGGTFFKVGGHKCTSKKLWKVFFIKRFTITIDPILIVLPKPI